MILQLKIYIYTVVGVGGEKALSNTTSLPEMLPEDDPGWMLEREVTCPTQD